MAQTENIKRVRDTIGPIIFDFMRERLVCQPEFVIRDLHDFVARQVEIAPASPQRILQLMRREGHFNYEVTNRRKSQYRVTAVYSPPQPEKTMPKLDPVRVMCRILMDKKVDLDDKYMVLTTLAETLFPDRPIFRDISDASDWPPSPEEIDAVIARFAARADVAGHQGSDDGPYWACVACIEWALGRPSTAEWVPCYVSNTIEEEMQERLDPIAVDKTLEDWEDEGVEQRFITRGVPQLSEAEDVSVCLTPGFEKCNLSVIRDGNCEMYPISKKVAAELIAAGFGYQG